MENKNDNALKAQKGELLDSWREETMGSYSGGSEYDATVEAIKRNEEQEQQM